MRLQIRRRQLTRVISALSIVAMLSLILLTKACSVEETPISSSRSLAQDSLYTLRLGFTSADGAKVPMSPEGWAISQGLIKRDLQNIGIADVRLIDFPNGPDVNEGLLAGELDVAIYGDVPGIVAKAKGFESRLIGFNQVGLNIWLAAPRENGPRSLAELKGKTVGVRKGSQTHRFLASLLQKVGLSNSVKVVHLLNQDAEAALNHNHIAAYAGSLRLVAEGFPVLDEAKNHPELQGTSIVVVPENFLIKHPNFPQQWTQIRKKALEIARSRTDQYFEFLAKSSKFPVKLIKAAYPLNSFPEEPFPERGIELIEKTKKFLVEEKFVKSDFKLNNWLVVG